MVILDTNIIIDHLRQSAVKSILLRLVEKYPKESLCLSVISVQELYEGRSTGKEELEKELLSTVTPLKIIPYTYEIAILAGKIIRDLARPIEFADAAIAATSIMNAIPLFTLNKKDFRMIGNLQIYDFD